MAAGEPHVYRPRGWQDLRQSHEMYALHELFDQNCCPYNHGAHAVINNTSHESQTFLLEKKNEAKTKTPFVVNTLIDMPICESYGGSAELLLKTIKCLAKANTAVHRARYGFAHVDGCRRTQHVCSLHRRCASTQGEQRPHEDGCEPPVMFTFSDVSGNGVRWKQALEMWLLQRRRQQSDSLSSVCTRRSIHSLP